jgi:hypothetical protein
MLTALFGSLRVDPCWAHFEALACPRSSKAFCSPSACRASRLNSVVILGLVALIFAPSYLSYLLSANSKLAPPVQGGAR